MYFFVPLCGTRGSPLPPVCGGIIRRVPSAIGMAQALLLRDCIDAESIRQL